MWLMTSLVLAGTVCATPTGTETLAIVPLRHMGAADSTTPLLDAAIRSAANTLKGVAVVEAPARAPDGRDCAAEPVCLAKLGRALEVDELIFGDVSVTPESRVLTLNLFDVAAGTVTAVSRTGINASVEEASWVAHDAVYQLKWSEQRFGRLVIEAPKDAEITIRGVATPHADIIVSPGMYPVKVGFKGHEWSVMAQVHFERTTKVKFGRNEKPAFEYSYWTIPSEMFKYTSFEEGKAIERARPVGLMRLPPLAALSKEEISKSSAAGGLVRANATSTGLTMGKKVGIGLWGATAVLAVVGVVELARASSMKADLRKTVDAGGFRLEGAAQALDKEDSATRARNIGWSALGAALATGVTGSVFFILSPALTQDGKGAGQVVVAGRF